MIKVPADIVLKIGVLVYNHEKYIADTLTSLINQKTNFLYEIYVFEDFSTDKSREIVARFAKEYPDKVIPKFNPYNYGDFWNLRKNFHSLDSKYVALLDGDDRWNYDYKIEEMLTFLEQNPSFAGASHNVLLDFGELRQTELLNKVPFDRSVHTVLDIISGYCYHHTSALIYRNILGGILPQKYYHPASGDWFLSMIFAEYGPIKYFDVVWSVYRIHDKGIWSKLNETGKKMRNIDATFHYNRLMNYKYDKAFGRMHFEIQRLYPLLEKNFSGWLQLVKYKILFCALNARENRLRYFRYFFRPIAQMLCSIFKVKAQP